MIIGISGKIGSGKDTVGKIIQGLVIGEEDFVDGISGFLEYYDDIDEERTPLPCQIKKFADTLKDIICMLIGCTREQLEDADFKNTELGEEWVCWFLPDDKYPKLFPKSADIEWIARGEKYFERKLTPRMLLQLLGTECGRNIIHPNIWVNALMSEYKWINNPNGILRNMVAPNWIITDMRFPNELKAVKDRGGITIRVNSNFKHGGNGASVYKGPSKGNRKVEPVEHESETALDSTEFDYVIDNNGTLEELIEKVREILIKEKIIS